MMVKKTKKDKNNKEPWSSQFGGDDYEKGQYSRSARHANKKDVAPLSKVLLFLFFALLIIPFATYYLNERTKNDPTPLSPEEVMINKQNSSEEESESEQSLADEDESKSNEAVADASSDDASSESEAASSADVESESKPESSQEESTVPPESEEEITEPELPDDTVYSNIYTVQAGDNLYRIALNHGMDLEELMEVNNLTSEMAQIGMTLKVK